MLFNIMKLVNNSNEKEISLMIEIKLLIGIPILLLRQENVVIGIMSHVPGNGIILPTHAFHLPL